MWYSLWSDLQQVDSFLWVLLDTLTPKIHALFLYSTQDIDALDVYNETWPQALNIQCKPWPLTYDLIFQDLDAPDVYETEDLPEDDQALQTTSEVKASIILDIVTFTKNIILNIVTFTTKY